MTINHLISKDYFFVDSFKDSKDNIILNVWDDINNSGEDYPTNNVILETLTPIIILNNQIEETLTMDTLLESDLVKYKESYSINKRLLPTSINVNDILYFVDAKDKLNLFYFDSINEKLFSLNATFKISEKEFTKDENNQISIKLTKTSSKVLDKVLGSEYCIRNNDLILLNGLDINSLDFNVEDNEDEGIVADSFAIDTFNNIYVILDGKYNLIENGKLKKITEKNIESLMYYLDENNEKIKLEEYTFNSDVNSFEKLTLVDLERFLWSIADVIRDKSKLNANDYINVSVPLMLLKRVLDTKEEYIHDVVLKSATYDNNLNHVYSNPQEALIESINTKIGSDNLDVFKIEIESKQNWYGVTWEDIVSFVENPFGDEKEIQLKKFDLKIKSKAKNVQEFMEEIIDTLNPKLHKLYVFTNFINLIKSNEKFPKVELIKILNDFNRYSLNYRNANEDIFSNAYMYLISKFAAGAGKKGGEFFTPTKLTQDLIPFMDIKLPEYGSITIADPTAGSGSFVVEVFNYLQKQNNLSLNEINDITKIIIQEKEEITYLFAEVNLLLRGVTEYDIFHNNTITEYNENTIGQYKNLVDYIVANPPYGLKDYGYEYAIDSGEDRWEFGVPNKGDGDYAFLLTINDLLTNVGKAGVILPLGTLFKDTTKKIRENFLNKDFIEGIIILPGNMFQTTSIPVCFWIVNKDKKEEDKGKIFMVNGSNEFIKEGKFNVFQPERCLHNYLNRLEEEGLSGYINIKDIIDENDSNLSVQRYVFKDEPEEVIDIVELNNIEKEYSKNIFNLGLEQNNLFNLILLLNNIENKEYNGISNINIYKKQRKYFQQELLSGKIRMKLNNKSMAEAFELGLIKQTFLNDANEIVEYGGDTITNVNIDIIDKDGFENWLSIDFENKIEFYKNIDFKEEKINGRIVSIPNDWTILLNKSIYERNDKSKTTPKNLLKEGLYPFFNCSETQRYFLDTFLLNKESILLSTGGIAAIHYINGKYSYSTDTLSIQIKNEKILTKYYYYFFKNFKKYLDESFQGSGLKHLNNNMFNKLNIFCSSSLIEQTLIATQLTKIDNLIESLEEEIKLEDKKFTYLKQELLS